MFYERLKELCKANNTTVSELARELGMSTGNTGHWKRGGTPSIAVLKKMADYFGVSIDYLLDLKDEG